MSMRRALLFILLLFPRPALAHAQGMLHQLAQEDQDWRAGKPVARTDDERIKIVLALVGEDMVKTPQEKYDAAIVLEHTGLDLYGRKLVSRSVDNYLLAHYLFISAYAGGIKDARYLIAASLDLYLSFTEGYQKYGTSRVVDQATGKELLFPVDRQTPDSERAQYGVPPLAELLKQYSEQPVDTARQ